MWADTCPACGSTGGAAKAKEYALTGKALSAPRPPKWGGGLIQQGGALDELEAEVARTARQLLSVPAIRQLGGDEADGEPGLQTTWGWPSTQTIGQIRKD